MSRIDDLLEELCPNGVEFSAIAEVANVGAGATPSKSVESYWMNGTIPWLNSGEVNKGTIFEADTFITQEGYNSCSTKMVPSGSVVMALAGQGKTRGMVARTRLECCTNQSLASIIPNERVDSDFLYHFLRTQYSRLREVSSGDGTRGGLNLAMIRAYRIPIPPLEVQREIVRILDQFTQLEAELQEELKAELEARHRQYEHYRRIIMAPASHWITKRLGDVVEFQNGKAHERIVDPDGEVILLTAGYISAGVTKARFVRSEDVLTPALVDDVALVMSDLPNGRALAKAFLVDMEHKYAANQRVCLLRPNSTSQLDSKFLYYTVNRNAQLRAYDSGVDQTHLKKDWILDIRIGIPPVEEQKRIAKSLDELNALVNDLGVGLSAELAARRKQYEYYRDQLLTFKEAA